MTLVTVIPTHTNGFCTNCYGVRYKVFTLTVAGVETEFKKCERCREETLVEPSDNLVEIEP